MNRYFFRLDITRTRSFQIKQYISHACIAGVFSLTLGCGSALAETDEAPHDPCANILRGISLPNNLAFRNPTGFASTYSTAGFIDLGNEFFQVLGTNGRSCSSCHLPQTGWTITPAEVRARFKCTAGKDPIFRPNDGSNSPFADVSTVAKRRAAYSMLLNKGVIRVGIGIPANAEFELVAVDDPYGFASEAELSLFRRPLPATNLKFLSTVMLDGRETFSGKTIHFDLADQANSATTGHAQGAPLSDAQKESIVKFETAMSTAQVFDKSAGWLNAMGGKGGPVNIVDQIFYIGINDLFGDSLLMLLSIRSYSTSMMPGTGYLKKMIWRLARR